MEDPSGMVQQVFLTRARHCTLLPHGPTAPSEPGRPYCHTHLDIPHSVGLWMGDQHDSETSTSRQKHLPKIYLRPDGIGTRNPRKRTAETCSTYIIK